MDSISTGFAAGAAAGNVLGVARGARNGAASSESIPGVVGDHSEISNANDQDFQLQMQQMRTLAQSGRAGAAYNAPQRVADPNAPLEIKAGQKDYYLQRNADYQRRHPGATAPDYYLEYGDKYAKRFTEQLRPEMSPQGQKWLDKTFVNLQQAMENKRQEDPAAYARLEQDPDAFRKFAYDSHAQAYLDAGLADLPVSDLVKIGMTPDMKDLLSKEGVGQMGEVIQKIYRDRGLGYFVDKAVQGAGEAAVPVVVGMAQAGIAVVQNKDAIMQGVAQMAVPVAVGAASVVAHRDSIMRGAVNVAAPGLGLAWDYFMK